MELQGQPEPFSISRKRGRWAKSDIVAYRANSASSATTPLSFSEALIAEGGRTIRHPQRGRRRRAFSSRPGGSFPGHRRAGQPTRPRILDIAWQVPANNSPFEAMNFSTFRLAMTHPVHPEWEALGGSIQLLDGNGNEVPVTVLVKGNRITVDPCVAGPKGMRAARRTYWTLSQDLHRVSPRTWPA